MPVLRLFCALVDPGADEADLVVGQFLEAEFVFRRGHEIIFVAEMSDVEDHHALGAFAGFDDFAVLAAFQGAFETVEAQLGFGLLFAVAFDAGGIKDGFDVGGVGDAGFGGGSGKFAGVHIGGEYE